MNLNNTKYVVLSVMGPHAGEDEAKIYQRKSLDIDKTGMTFWLMRSNQAKPDAVQQMCKAAKSESADIYCYFIDPSSRMGASPTKCAESADAYSHDNIVWSEFPSSLGPVTGRIDKGAYALVFNQIRLSKFNIDLWDYSNYFKQTNPIIFRQGGSTVCSVQKDSSAHPMKIQSNVRVVRAVARLTAPYAVWLK